MFKPQKHVTTLVKFFSIKSPVYHFTKALT